MRLDISLLDVTDFDMERATLAALLNSPHMLTTVIAETGLTSNSFADPHNRAVYEQIITLHTEGHVPSSELVTSHLNGNVPSNYIADLLLTSQSPAQVLSYAKRVVEIAEWRHRKETVIKAIEAIEHKDNNEFMRAISASTNGGLTKAEHFDAAALTEEFKSYMNSNQVEAIKLPFPTLNKHLGGGLKRGQMTILGGWTSHGKSVVIDQVLEEAGRQGFSAHLYMNEMTHEERVSRYVTRHLGIHQDEISSGKLSDSLKHKVIECVQSIPFSVTPCAGWSVEELTYDIRSREYDLIGIDILHLFDYDSEIELARISRLLNRVAKQAGCHVIATVHLNEFRANDTIRPRPVTRDIRGSGMLKNDADNVMMIYRQQHPTTGDPSAFGSLYTCKVRNGSLGSQSLIFDDELLLFRPAERPSNEPLGGSAHEHTQLL